MQEIFLIAFLTMCGLIVLAILVTLALTIAHETVELRVRLER